MTVLLMIDVVRIEIVAIGREKLFSAGAVELNEKRDLYIFHKMKTARLHTARHASGDVHWKIEDSEQYIPLGKRCPIAEFVGFETFGAQSFGVDSLPELFKEYEMQKCNGVFAIDMREYETSAFNMSVAILTKEGFPQLLDMWKDCKKRQIYLFTDSNPMIAIIVIDAKSPENKQPIAHNDDKDNNPQPANQAVR
jgi:hypothetical protein